MMNLGGPQIFQLISLLAVLALFSLSARNHIGYARWFKKWEADRKARRDAELKAQAGEEPEKPNTGPWG